MVGQIENFDVFTLDLKLKPSAVFSAFEDAEEEAGGDPDDEN
jgi:hypothetical protein